MSDKGAVRGRENGLNRACAGVLRIQLGDRPNQDIALLPHELRKVGRVRSGPLIQQHGRGSGPAAHQVANRNRDLYGVDVILISDFVSHAFSFVREVQLNS